MPHMMQMCSIERMWHMVTRVQVLNEVSVPHGSEGFRLCFQWCRYVYGDNTLDYGYRFIWKNPTGGMMAHRGQARIQSIALMMQLSQMAIDAGWGNYDGSAVVATEKARLGAMAV
jgi:hypothetical protein